MSNKKEAALPPSKTAHTSLYNDSTLVSTGKGKIENILPQDKQHYGATIQEWMFFDLCLGQTKNLLPVVSNPNAVISKRSSLKAIGKSPSTYNQHHEVIGFTNWTNYRATPHDITKWCAKSDYGICLQTREIRALDIDIEDQEKSAQIREFICKFFDNKAPVRFRRNSGKCLIAFKMIGEFSKRILKVDGEMIEFLGNGQHFVAAGTHKSGVRYEWNGYNDFPEITHEKFEALWATLVEKFSDDETIGSVLRNRADTPTLNIDDPVLDKLDVLDWGKNGGAFIDCPFKSEHTMDSGITQTVYFPAGSRGYEQGHFHCLHAHCAERDDADFMDALKLRADMFDVISETDDNASTNRFTVVDADDFANQPELEWIIEGVLPERGFVMVTGASGSGKTFFVLDLMRCIALGIPWRGLIVKQGRVLYIAAEGAAGFRNRIKAYKEYYNISFNKNFGVIDDSPNLRQRDDIALAESIRRSGGGAVIVIDTLAQVTPGADENTGKDMNLVLARCKALHRATGALIILVHHLGKDETKGARGWSGMKAAMDTEIEIKRKDNERSATITKQKDGEDGAVFSFILSPVTVGLNRYGKEITSCVVKHIDSDTEKTPEPKGKWKKAVYNAIQDISFSANESISVETVISEAIKNEPHDTGKSGRDRRRDNARRAISDLCREGFVRLEDNKIFIPQSHNIPQI